MLTKLKSALDLPSSSAGLVRLATAIMFHGAAAAPGGVTKNSSFEHDEDLSGYSGGDFALVRDWVQAVPRHDEDLLTSNLAASMEHHLIGFAAE